MVRAGLPVSIAAVARHEAGELPIIQRPPRRTRPPPALWRASSATLAKLGFTGLSAALAFQKNIQLTPADSSSGSPSIALPLVFTRPFAKGRDSPCPAQGLDGLSRFQCPRLRKDRENYFPAHVQRVVRGQATQQLPKRPRDAPYS
jgi:hypothetical protein